MFIVQKMTQRYDGLEDRIQVNLQDADGRVISLWLTLRLANMMLNVLAKWADELEADVNNQKKKNTDASPTEIGLDVKSSAAKEEALLTTIDFSHGDRGYALTFKWGVTGAARITLQARELRHYLEGFSRLYDIAKWPKTAWPISFLSIESSEAETPDFDSLEVGSNLVH
ncbi:hypothetical protein MCEZLEM10_00318 [Methylophilaceae bacterium]